MATKDKPKFTPGPWQHNGHYGVGCENAKIGGFAKLFDVRGWGYFTGNGHGGLGLSTEDAMAVHNANAALIAAAPDMYEALNRIAKWIEGERISYLIDTDDNPGQTVRNAIAKAEGRQP